jgi:hypothetical protein
MFPQAAGAVAKGGGPIATRETRLYERLERELGPDWSVIQDCAIRAGGESQSVDFVLIHHAFGIAAVGAAPGRTGEPADAAAALRAMLTEIGFTQRFPGGIAVVAGRLTGAEPGNLAEQLFAGEPRCTISDPTWPEWLIHRLVPAPAERRMRSVPPLPAGAARLRAPSPEEAWRVAAAALRPPSGGEAPIAADAPTGVAAPDRPIASVSQSPRTKRTWWIDMGLAFVVVGLVLVGMALLSHGNGPARPPVAAVSGSSQ